MADTNDKELAKRAQDLVKRYAAAHKAALGKVAHHMGLAKKAHAKGMAHLAKAAACMTEAHKLGKAADAGTLAGHISKAHEAFSQSADHMDDVEAHLGKAMSAFGHDTNVDEDTEVGGEITIPGLTELTEGHVPWYDADNEYGGGGEEEEPYGKGAKGVKKLMKKIMAGFQSGAILTKDAAEKMIQSAVEAASSKATVEALTKQVELLSRLPAGSPKVQTFDFAKTPLPGIGTSATDEGKDRLAKLFNGVNVDSLNDPRSLDNNAAKMIANMIGDRLNGGSSFGKSPIFDGSFHGAAGRGRAGNRAVSN